MHLPDVYEIPTPRDGNLASWLTAFVVTAIMVGTTLALVAGHMPDMRFQIAINR
jgi:hypothetical protein